MLTVPKERTVRGYRIHAERTLVAAASLAVAILLLLAVLPLARSLMAAKAAEKSIAFKNQVRSPLEAEAGNPEEKSLLVPGCHAAFCNAMNSRPDYDRHTGCAVSPYFCCGCDSCNGFPTCLDMNPSHPPLETVRPPEVRPPEKHFSGCQPTFCDAMKNGPYDDQTGCSLAPESCCGCNACSGFPSCPAAG